MGIYLNGKMVSTLMPLSTGSADSSVIDSKIAAHNSNANAHSTLFSALDTRVQNLENGDGCLVTSVNSKQGDVVLTANDVGAISTTMLDAVINTALASYALKSEIPTKTSQLTNDSGFLTSHQSLSGYATQTWVTSQIQSAIDATWEASY